MYQIGVDIGGTNIKVGLVSETLELLQSCSVRFPHDGARSVVKTIEEAVNFLLQQQNIPRGQLESVGIVVPGSIDQTGERVIDAYNLGFHDVPLKALVQEAFEGVPVYLANDANGAALSGSMDCGEGVDSASLRLPDGQHELFARVRAAAKKLVTVLIIGRPYAVPEIAEGSDGLLVAFYPGPWGGQALAEVLLGRFSPSGRLPVSFPRHPGQLPVYYNPKAGIVPWSYADSKQGPLFSFGDGMGYGRLQYRDFELLPKPLPEGTLSKETLSERKLPVDDTPVLELRFRAENPGPAEETAVPMLFVTDLESDVTRRVRELKAFDKKAVPAGGSAAFSLTLTAEGLAGWNRRMERELQRGRFRLCLQDGGRSLYETIWTL